MGLGITDSVFCIDAAKLAEKILFRGSMATSDYIDDGLKWALSWPENARACM